MGSRLESFALAQQSGDEIVFKGVYVLGAFAVRPLFRVKCTWTICGCGQIKFESESEALRNDMPYLPRFGF